MNEKKQTLLEAAKKIFAEKGYNNTNIANITKEAGIAVGSFYKFYQSKEEVFLAVYTAENTRIREFVMAEVDWDSPPLALLNNLWESTLQHLSGNRILSEWNNPKVSSILSDYYASEEGKKDNKFHQYILSHIEEYLGQKGFSSEKIAEFSMVYSLFYLIDLRISEAEFPAKFPAMKSLISHYVESFLQEESTSEKTN